MSFQTGSDTPETGRADQAAPSAKPSFLLTHEAGAGGGCGSCEADAPRMFGRASILLFRRAAPVNLRSFVPRHA